MRDRKEKKSLHEMLTTDMSEGIGIKQILINEQECLLQEDIFQHKIRCHRFDHWCLIQT